MFYEEWIDFNGVCNLFWVVKMLIVNNIKMLEEELSVSNSFVLVRFLKWFIS